MQFMVGGSDKLKQLAAGAPLQIITQAWLPLSKPTEQGSLAEGDFEAFELTVSTGSFVYCAALQGSVFVLQYEAPADNGYARMRQLAGLSAPAVPHTLLTGVVMNSRTNRNYLVSVVNSMHGERVQFNLLRDVGGVSTYVPEVDTQPTAML